jgi:hypothetical protein
MLRNINNFFNILKKGRIKKTLKDNDMVPIGTRDTVNKSKYYDTAITFKDFKSEVASGSGVTAVTGTAPVVSSGGTTPDISMLPASSVEDGYLKQSQFIIFSNKQDALTLTTTGSGAATLIGSTLNIPTPTASPLLSASVTVTAAEIIANTAVTILPAPVATKYYVIHNATVKFKGGTVAFDASDAWNASVSVGTAALPGSLNPGLTVFNMPTNLTDAILCTLNGSINAGQALTFNPHVIGSITTGDSEVVYDVTYELKDF